LDYTTLLNSVSRLLCENGSLAVLLPYDQSQNFVRIAHSKGLHLQRQLLIRNRPDKSFIRIIMIFASSPVPKTEIEVLSIKKECGEYSDFFQRLLQDFYLYL